jgi:hypothetical protein
MSRAPGDDPPRPVKTWVDGEVAGREVSRNRGILLNGPLLPDELWLSLRKVPVGVCRSAQWSLDERQQADTRFLPDYGQRFRNQVECSPTRPLLIND